MGYVRCGMPCDVVKLHEKLKECWTIDGTTHTFLALKWRTWKRGYEIHAMIEKNSYLDMYHVVMLRNHFIAVKLCTSCKMRVFFQIYVAVDNSLVDMYDKCGLLAEATRVFKSCLVKDVVSWTSIITGYAEHGYGDETWLCPWNIWLDIFSWKKHEINGCVHDSSLLSAWNYSKDCCCAWTKSISICLDGRDNG